MGKKSKRSSGPPHGAGEEKIQVVVRVRPLNSKEKKRKSKPVLKVFPRRAEVSLETRDRGKKLSKKYQYDKVFGPDTLQEQLFQGVAHEVVQEVLKGFNCTVFAYGQTGTGKTYTMEGVKNEKTGVYKERDAGIIPRAMRDIFDTLNARDDVKFKVKVSLLEIYNEKLTDLLAVADKKLTITENARKEIEVVNQVAVPVFDVEDIYKLLRGAWQKRVTAKTAMNDKSSRSHCIMTATVHMVTTGADGEDRIKTGKLNLVDLAGSENIGRSQAKDKQAREAGNINKSLLQLGIVINALTSGDRPVYRGSKLTRLLKDSLGGTTKTCIIATVSPAEDSMEETLSTLDYALKAKDINNRPEVNEQLTEQTMLSEYVKEIEKLKGELTATRDKVGVFLSQESIEERTTYMEQLKERVQEIQDQIQQVIDNYEDLCSMLTKKDEELRTHREQHEATRALLAETQESLVAAQSELEVKLDELAEARALLGEHEVEEEELRAQADELKGHLSTHVEHIEELHAKVQRQRAVETHNRTAAVEHHVQVVEAVKHMHADLDAFATAQRGSMDTVADTMRAGVAQLADRVSGVQDAVDTMVADVRAQHGVLTETHEAAHAEARDAWQAWDAASAARTDDVLAAGEAAQSDVHAALDTVEAQLQQQASALQAWGARMIAQLQSRMQDVHAFTDAQKSALATMQERMHTHTTAHRDTLAAQQAQLQRLTASVREQARTDEDALMGALTQMVQQRSAAHREHVASELAAVSASIAAAATDVATCTSELATEATAAADATTAMASALGERHAKHADVHVDAATAVAVDLDAAAAVHDTHTSALRASAAAFAAGAKENASNVRALWDGVSHKHGATAAHIDAAAAAQRDAIAVQCGEVKHAWGENEGAWNGEWTDMAERNVASFEAAKERVSGVGHTVQSFVGMFRTVQATGATPAKDDAPVVVRELRNVNTRTSLLERAKAKLAVQE